MKKKPVKGCPHCGETIDAHSKACPFCGSDERTGWSDSVYLDGIDLDDDFDYDEAKSSEFTNKTRKYPFSVIVTAVALLLLYVFWLMRRILF